MTSHIRCIAGAAVILLLAMGCAHDSNSTLAKKAKQTRKELARTATSRDAWYLPPADSGRFSSVNRLPETDVLAVVATQRQAACQKLVSTPCVELSWSQAAEMTGRQVRNLPNSRWFLVRGLFLNPRGGHFEVISQDGELFVNHTSKGKTAMPMKRQPLVVKLGTRPQMVYVSCSMSQ